jgi:PAS domain S-box-containing protein
MPFQEIIHADDHPALARTQTLLTAPPFETTTEVRCHTVQGWRWILWEETSCLDTSGQIIAIRSVGHDVTRRHIAEEQSFFMAQAMEQSPIATAIADLDGYICYANSSYCECVCAGLETLIEQRQRIFRDAHPDEDTYQAFLRQIRNGHPWRGEVCGNLPSGERWEFVRVSAIRSPSGSVSHLMMLREDLSERRMLEAQLRQAQKMELVGSMAGGIAHDFNNLLAVINGYTELMISRSDTTERSRHFLGEVFKAGQRAVGLVRQILTFSRKAEPVPAPIDLNQSIRDTIGMLQETFPRTISFNLELTSELPVLMADPNQIQQVFMNLCVNARDAMPEGGTLTITTDRIQGKKLAHLGGDPSKIYQCFRVKDTGIGMEPAVQRRIFEPFYTTKDKTNGTGLGLALVEGIVFRHGGLIDLSSTPGLGSTFTILIPETKQNCKQARTPLPPQSEAAMTGRILVVEDEDGLRQLTQGLLEARGFTVQSVGDGASALEFLAERSHDIDCVVLDVNMPRLNGVSVLQVIRQKYNHLGVVVVSGYLSEEIKQQLMELGLDAFVHKPFRLNDLLSKLQRVLTPALHARTKA